MFKLLDKKRFVVWGVLMSIMLTIPSGRSFADNLETYLLKYSPAPSVVPGANIRHGNCDPGADPWNDKNRSDEEKYERSCIGQGIDINNFEVTFHFKGDPIWALIVARQICTPLSLVPGKAASIAYAACVTANAAPIIAADEDITLKIGEQYRTAGFLINFKNRVEGDMSCIYARVATPFIIGDLTIFKDGYYSDTDGDNKAREPEIGLGIPAVPGEESYNQAANQINQEKAAQAIKDVEDAEDSKIEALPLHCVFVPPPRLKLNPPQWSNLISPICTNFDSGASQFKYSDGKNRSFIGVSVQCVEDTLTNIFDSKDKSGSSFFSTMQDRMQDLIRALLALYVIFFGYQFVIEKKGIKQNEWQWFALKFGLVLYFAAGPGMVNLMPDLLSTMKNFSIIVMEAGSGKQGDIDEAKAGLQDTENEYNAARDRLVAARYQYGLIAYELTKDPNNATLKQQLNAAAADRDAAQAVVHGSLQNYRVALDLFNSYGYRYCDFRGIEQQGGYVYHDTDPSGASRTRNLTFMKLWDMMDCKISKYLGVGDYKYNRTAPQSLIIAVGIITSHAYGIIIFLLMMVFLIFILLIIIRIVHLYVMAMVGVILLIYISPLTIPTVLFSPLKKIFDKWLSLLIGFIIQPMILFTFLALLFAVYDMVIYDNNHKFVPMTTEHHINENKMCMKSIKDKTLICGAQELDTHPADDMECVDKDTIGCIYQTVNIKEKHVIFGMKKFVVDTSDSQGKAMLVSMIKLLFISFIAHAVLGLVESMAQTLTNAVAPASGAPAPNPATIGKAVTGALDKAKDVVAAGVAGAAKASKTSREGAKDELKKRNQQRRARNNEARNRALHDRGGQETNSRREAARLMGIDPDNMS